MPLREDDLQESRRRVWSMFMDTMNTFAIIESRAEEIYGPRAPIIRSAIQEYVNDFIRNTQDSGESHPEVLIFQASRERLQRSGFYGSQLDIKEHQVTTANASLRERLRDMGQRLWKRPFRKWVDIINNFLGSLIPATGVGEALKELKDCLRDELPEDDEP